MCFEDASVLGECVSRITSHDVAEKRKALAVYELCRKLRTEKVVQRGVIQQDINHFPDGPKQIERDQQLRKFEAVEAELKQGSTNPQLSQFQPEEDPMVWRRYGLGPWLLSYDCKRDVEEKWTRAKV